MPKRERDTKAEYAARKARLAARGETLYRQRNQAAKRLGYDSLGDQRARRKAGDLTHADHANQAKKVGGRYVTNAGGGRWTWASDDHGIQPLTIEDRARLAQTLDRAHRADVNLTITAGWYHAATGRRGTAQAGGDYGVRARRIHGLGADGDESLGEIETELRNVLGSDLPAGAIITSLHIYAYPSIERKAA